MIKKAIEKLQSEIEQSKNNPYVQVVGSFLIGHLENKPEDAEKIMTADKTIAKSLDEMKNVAAKKKVGNFAVLTGQEAFAIVFKYFGIESAVEIPVLAATPIANAQKPIATPKKSKVDFEVNLDDFL